MNEIETIHFTPEMRDRLQEAYDRATLARKDVFIFNGHEYYTKYAKYLLQYLSSQFDHDLA
jgi:hypothetical protein